MKIGDLKKRVTIQKSTPVADGGGGFSQDWDTHAEVFAHMHIVAAGFDKRFDRRQHRDACRFVIPYRNDIDSNMRILDGAQVYTITAIRDPDQQQRWLEIMAEAAGP